jgi:hypothetical protein
MGPYTNTQASDDAYQTITEETYAGKRSRLEHVWDFGQINGATKFVVEAFHDSSAENFEFAYSTDSVNWITMIDGISTTEAVHKHVFGVPLSGAIQVRVIDTDRGKDPTLDTVSINEMYFLTQTGTVLPTVVTITATDAAAAEADLDPAVFTVSRTGDLEGDLVVHYTIGGTAVGASDYATLTGSVTILDGDPSATITVTPIGDDVDEGNETVILTLALDAAYTIGSADSDTVTIADDDGVTPVETVIDDGDGDAVYTEIGSWKSKANEGAYDSDYSYATAGDGTKTATWTFTVLAGGNYDVFATWVAHPTKHASNAPYTVNGSPTTVDQRYAPVGDGGWQQLGTTYSVDASGTLTVQLSNNADGYVIADAIRVVPAPAGASMEVESSGATDLGAAQLAAVDFLLGQDDTDLFEDDPVEEADGYVIADPIRVDPIPASAGIVAESSGTADLNAAQVAASDLVLGQDASNLLGGDPAEELQILLSSDSNRPRP